jgi:hypothetical protein
MLPCKSRNIGRIVVVGCIDNEGHAASQSERRANVVVSVFPTELSGSYFNVEGAVRPLTACLELARDFPDVQFQVKAKDPLDADRLLTDPTFQKSYAEVEGNFSFIRQARYDVGGLIAASDLVIALGWTTPSGIAITQEKRLILYDDLGAGEGAYRGLPNLIARTPSELKRVFEIALDDYDRYAAEHVDAISRLDPFRDGRARARVLDELVGPAVDWVMNEMPGAGASR